ncbi:MAG: PAS domain S-box protein, partial [Candidatus Hydrogenedentes bacterium]|nr:PAS domain S-box protein [Candidatus Hydrogenedentota bacterium]
DPAHAELRTRLKQQQIVRGYEWQLRLKSGGTRWLYEDARLMTPQRELAQFIQEPYMESVIRDISVRKHKESVFYSDQRKYQTILEGIHEGYYEMSMEGHLTFFNRALSNILGVSEEKLLGRNPADFFHNDAIFSEMRKIYFAQQKGEISDVLLDWHLERNDGSKVVLEISVSLMYDTEGKRNGFRGLVRDVTERATAEEASRIAETRYKNLFEEANDIVYTHDFQGKFTSLNKEGERLSGYSNEEATKISVYEIIVPELREKALDMTRRRLQGEDVGKYEVAILAKDGHHIPVEVSARLIVHDGKPIGVQGIARDITDRLQAEEQRQTLERQVQHAQKLEGLGVLAGGIAHDFN